MHSPDLNSATELERLRARVEERDRLLAGLIHDLRNPLNIILTWTHLLHEGRLDGGTTLRAHETVRRNAELQARLLSSFVDYVRLEDDQAELKLVAMDLSPLVATAVGVVRSRAQEKPIHFDVDLEADSRRVRADAEWLGHALRAMVQHAVDATPAAGRIALRLGASDGEALLEIRRTGDPLGPEELEWIFEPLSPSNRESGRGSLHLEMALASRVARLHGGRVMVENVSETEGAVYSLSLPLVF